VTLNLARAPNLQPRTLHTKPQHSVVACSRVPLHPAAKEVGHAPSHIKPHHPQPQTLNATPVAMNPKPVWTTLSP